MGRLPVALLGLLAAGCMSASVHRLDQDLRPPRPPEGIAVLDETPEEPYAVIAHIACESGVVFHGTDDLQRRLVEEAAALGGDALILGALSTESHPLFLGTAMIMSEEKVLEGDVIVYGPRPAVESSTPNAAN
jgi:hypothetical protein